MRIDFYSIVMATITSSVLILIIFFATKNRRLNKYFGLSCVIVLYIASIVRMAVPVEFYRTVVKLCDPVVYRFVIYCLYQKVGNQPNYAEPGFRYVHLLVLLLLFVAAIFLVRMIKQYRRFIKYTKQYPNLATNREKRFFEQECEKIGFKRRITFKVIDENIVPMTFGILHPVVLLPCNDYTDEQLPYILRHELIHQKNHDILLKLLIEVYCCLFWWNPLTRLLKKDLDRKLELKCDERAIKDFDDDKKLLYLSAIVKCLKKANNSKDSKLTAEAKSSFLGFMAVTSETPEIEERFNYILDIPAKKYSSKLFVVGLSLACFTILVLSYIFIFQPKRDMDFIDSLCWEDGATFVADETNSYLVEQPDGEYIWYFETPNGLDSIPATKEDVENGLYYIYPIYRLGEEVVR